jgi:hypothetical protein
MPKPNTKYNHNIPFSYFQNIFLNERNKFWAKQLILVDFKVFVYGASTRNMQLPGLIPLPSASPFSIRKQMVRLR